MLKKTIYLLPLIFLIVSCGALDSAKRGLTGAKAESADEFLVKKKDPLVLPPDFENLPTPGGEVIDVEEMLSFEKTLKTESLIDNTNPTASSTEESILREIRKK